MCYNVKITCITEIEEFYMLKKDYKETQKMVANEKMVDYPAIDIGVDNENKVIIVTLRSLTKEVLEKFYENLNTSLYCTYVESNLKNTTTSTEVEGKTQLKITGDIQQTVDALRGAGYISQVTYKLIYTDFGLGSEIFKTENRCTIL